VLVEQVIRQTQAHHKVVLAVLVAQLQVVVEAVLVL
jgi:hypothetical protein